MADKTQHNYGADVGTGRLSSCDDSSISDTTWREFQVMLNKSVKGGQLSSNGIVSTYTLVNTPIDVGAGTGDYNTTFTSGGYTWIDYNNPCNLTGIITTFQITLLRSPNTCYLGIFTKNAGNYFTATAWSDNLSAYLTSAGTKTITGLFLPIASGQYIGIYVQTGSSIEINTSSGSGVYHVAGKPSVNSSTLYTLWNAAYKMAVYGTGGSLLNYAGGVLDSNGNIHFIPCSTPYGHKISPSNVISTYSLVYTRSSSAYYGGVLASNGDIHFVPHYAVVGQKVSASGIVSTYSLVYTGSALYIGGVLATNGDIHFIPYQSLIGQKVSASGTVSTYSLVYTSSQGYFGGVLDPNGNIHFVPFSANRGQKISSGGVVSTYSLVYTGSNAYGGGVLAPNGDIHFIPFYASVGQKISSTGTVSTYSLVYTKNGAYVGGVLAPNGDIHFVPFSASVGQKISSGGVVSTYSLVYTAEYVHTGGVLDQNGDIHFAPFTMYYGQKISTLPAIPFGHAVCCSPFFNKY